MARACQCSPRDIWRRARRQNDSWLGILMQDPQRLLILTGGRGWPTDGRVSDLRGLAREQTDEAVTEVIQDL